MDAVFRDLDAFTEKAPAADDRTLVVVKRTVLIETADSWRPVSLLYLAFSPAEISYDIGTL